MHKIFNSVPFNSKSPLGILKFKGYFFRHGVLKVIPYVEGCGASSMFLSRMYLSFPCSKELNPVRKHFIFIIYLFWLLKVII